jgi:hypothetical protein
MSRQGRTLGGAVISVVGYNGKIEDLNLRPERIGKAVGQKALNGGWW